MYFFEEEVYYPFLNIYKNMSGFFPAEWAAQRFVQLTWPHENTDWYYMLDEVTECFVQIARQISLREPLLIVTQNPDGVRERISPYVNMQNVTFAEVDTNDTWARDHGGITIFEDDNPVILDFQFNGWGLKFPADKDNLITEKLHKSGYLFGELKNCRGFVFEGGSIESDGEGTLLTTSECLLSPNRNAQLSKIEIEQYLINTLHAKRVLWLENGFLQGDDTDSHIDTLARLCPNSTIVYVQCKDEEDVHYEALAKMEQELKAFRTLDGEPYRLLPLPMALPAYEGDERLPATYANFLIINGAVLVPVYGTERDEDALRVMRIAFPDREIVPINCSALIRQHGSLHCVTMQYPK